MASEPCPRCGKDSTLPGSTAEPLSTRSSLPQTFQPAGIRLIGHLIANFGKPTAVYLPEPFRACLNCGFVWNELSREELAKLVEILEREGITHDPES